MKNVLMVIVIVVVVYFGFKRTDAVQSIEFRGDTYELSDSYERSGSGVYMYTPNGENFLRAGKYIQVAHLPKVDISVEEFRRQVAETGKTAAGYSQINDKSFFYVEANSLVHSTLVQDGDRFKYYNYVEVLPDDAPKNVNNYSATPSIAVELEQTISSLPLPPRTFSTWF